ncbi:hypothetical protein ACFE04_023394 [Oxalis oulophora]
MSLGASSSALFPIIHYKHIFVDGNFYNNYDILFFTHFTSNYISKLGQGEVDEVMIKIQPPARNCITTCKKLDGVVAWLFNLVVGTFFASVERCHCFYVDTLDDSEDITAHWPLTGDD